MRLLVTRQTITFRERFSTILAFEFVRVDILMTLECHRIGKDRVANVTFTLPTCYFVPSHVLSMAKNLVALSALWLLIFVDQADYGIVSRD